MATVITQDKIQTRPSRQPLPPFWTSLFNARNTRDAARPEKPSAVVGDLWIQIR